jgi:hypothetical protein
MFSILAKKVPVGGSPIASSVKVSCPLASGTPVTNVTVAAFRVVQDRVMVSPGSAWVRSAVKLTISGGACGAGTVLVAVGGSSVGVAVTLGVGLGVTVLTTAVARGVRVALSAGVADSPAVASARAVEDTAATAVAVPGSSPICSGAQAASSSPHKQYQPSLFIFSPPPDPEAPKTGA